MNAEQMALIAAIAQDIENISMRLQELVRQTLIAAEEKTDWRALPPCLSESPSSIMEVSESPTSVVSTPELVVSEVCCDGAACVHRCTVCLADLTLRDEEGFCWTCVEEIKTVPTDCNIVNGFQAPAPYKNRFWPSPRPKLFAKACAPEQKFKKHQDALEFLARRAGTTVENLLKMSPATYIQKHMGNKAPYRLRR